MIAGLPNTYGEDTNHGGTELKQPVFKLNIIFIANKFIQSTSVMNTKTPIQLRASKIFLTMAFSSLCLLGSVASVSAQTNTATQGKLLPDGYTLLPGGFEYKIITHGEGKKKPGPTDHIELHISCGIGDSILFDTRKNNFGKCVPVTMPKPEVSGDPALIFMLMVAGDSAVARYSIDSIRKSGKKLPEWTKDGDKLVYKIKLVSVKTEAEYNKEEAEKTATQNAIDDKQLQAYFKAHGIKPTKTASGIYCLISKEGTGENIKAGQTVGVNYTGMFYDGKKFDSNTDTVFHHTQVFKLEVGKGKVIKGWDEGLQLLRTGSKATLYIPSSLAYGPQERPGIPGNSIMIFDVEIVELPDYSKIDDKIIKEYLDKNKIKATRTPSGLYYVIHEDGMGETAKPGKKVTMSYTGMTLDGKVFDSNMDPKFGHVQPFSFNLGIGQVIQGWDEGVQLLKIGSKASFFIPSALAYGEQGAGAAIPPNAVLVFDVELIKIE